MAQANFALPDQLRYDTSTPSSLGTELTMSVVTPIWKCYSKCWKLLYYKYPKIWRSMCF